MVREYDGTTELGLESDIAPTLQLIQPPSVPRGRPMTSPAPNWLVALSLVASIVAMLLAVALALAPEFWTTAL